MNREQRGVLRSERAVYIERLHVGWRFRIQYVSPPNGDDVDGTCIVHLEGIAGDYF